MADHFEYKQESCIQGGKCWRVIVHDDQSSFGLKSNKHWRTKKEAEQAVKEHRHGM